MKRSLDHHKRFDKWRSRLPETTAYLVDLVLARIVSQFESKGFEWPSDFAGGDPTQIGAYQIPLQRRSGDRWPTVQITFDPRRYPHCGLLFASLPPVCRRWRSDHFEEIPREQALVFEGTRHFALCKAGGSVPCQFGYRWFALRPRRYLESEVDALSALLPELFALFDKGIPKEWLSRGPVRVTEHVLVMPRLGPPGLT